MITSEKGGPDPQDSPLPKNRISLVYTYLYLYYRHSKFWCQMAHEMPKIPDRKETEKPKTFNNLDG